MVGVRNLLRNAVLAAVYVVLTVGLEAFSYGPVQVRVSEALTLLAFCSPHYVPGLVLGCFLANIMSPFGVTDMVVGTAATFLAVYGMRFCPNLFVASLLPVVSNGVIIGAELAYLAALPPGMPMAAAMVYIGLGEFLSVSVIGVLLLKVLMKSSRLRALFEAK